MTGSRAPQVHSAQELAPLEFAIPKPILKRAAYIAFGTVGTLTIRYPGVPGVSPDRDSRTVRASWPMDVPGNRIILLHPIPTSFRSVGSSPWIRTTCVLPERSDSVASSRISSQRPTNRRNAHQRPPSSFSLSSRLVAREFPLLAALLYHSIACRRSAETPQPFS